MTVEKLQLTLHATGLKNIAGLGKGTSDPYAIVTLLASGPGEKPRILGKTEVIKNSLSPKWTTSFLFDYSFGKETHINVSVVDEIRKQSDKTMGSAVFEIGDILGSRGSTKAKTLKRSGILYARISKAPPRSAGKLALRLRGIKLKNVDGLFSKSDPFFEIRRTHDGGAGGGSWSPVYRGKHMNNNLNPKWEPASIDVNVLCDGDLNKRIQVAVYDHEKKGKHNPMGAFDTTVNELVKSVGGKFELKKGSKTYGTIAVDECKIVGAETSSVMQPPSAPAVATATAPAAASYQPSMMPVPVPVAGFGNMNLGGQPLPVPVPPPKKPTFVDYVSGNCDLNMCVAIDFTGSNGDPRRPGTLHHFSPHGQMNGYEKAISAIGGIVAKYDSDQQFPVYGFGAKYDGVVRHCFQVGNSREVHGVAGILDAYKGVFKTPLIMSGPTVFTEVIQLAATQAKQRYQINPLSYSILLLLTDGAVTDVEATRQVLASVADAPLSIVIVGIGNADFSAMQFLDDFETRSGVSRDIVQFVQFSAHEHNKASLTRATLDEIPDQLVQFFHSRGIMPQADSNFSASKIVIDDYNEEADIDLSMDYGSDGEIALNGDVGCYIDNSYEAGIGKLHVMPPPTAPSGSAPVMAASVPAQPFTFQVQVPPNVTSGQQIQIAHPQTGQPLIVAVPAGVPPGGIFTVSA
uniref:C2 domain-containing protein n=1 Tax=Skeletonema marinoi TaxID=267567 RepID=A0A7S2PR51_9STRA|mmetsp:Transcript_27602/g.46729  ORF Transcript_27602/g.46729 Transcript_27602/m.46729 type:complete len:687 (+) Transcript_27602:172-2232(+)